MTVTGLRSTFTCATRCGKLFTVKDGKVVLADDALSKLHDEVGNEPAQSVYDTSRNLLSWWQCPRIPLTKCVHNENTIRGKTTVRPAIIIDRMTSRSLPLTPYSFMLWDVGPVYSGIMYRNAGVKNWEDAGLLVVDVLYQDYWRSWDTQAEVWQAYQTASEAAGQNLDEHVAVSIKSAVIYNTTTAIIERTCPLSGTPDGKPAKINALRYRSYESVCYGFAEVYNHLNGRKFTKEQLELCGWLVVGIHDVFDFPRDSREDNDSNSAHILDGYNGLDGFEVLCAIFVFMWRYTQTSTNATAKLYEYAIASSCVSNLCIDRYEGLKQLSLCTIQGKWDERVKQAAIEIANQLDSSLPSEWIEADVLPEPTFTKEEVFTTTLDILYNGTRDDLIKYSVAITNSFVQSTLFVNRVCPRAEGATIERDTWA